MFGDMFDGFDGSVGVVLSRLLAPSSRRRPGSPRVSACTARRPSSERATYASAPVVDDRPKQLTDEPAARRVDAGLRPYALTLGSCRQTPHPSSRRTPIRANFEHQPAKQPSSFRTPVCPKSLISLAKRAIRNPMALKLVDSLALTCCNAIGSRIADFSDQIKDLEKSRVRDDGEEDLRQRAKVSAYGRRPASIRLTAGSWVGAYAELPTTDWRRMRTRRVTARGRVQVETRVDPGLRRDDGWSEALEALLSNGKRLRRCVHTLALSRE